MKPSERIRDIQEELFGILGYPDRRLTAIERYLDEEWEKNKPCEHEWKPYTGVWGASVPPPKNICSRCGITK